MKDKKIIELINNGTDKWAHYIEQVINVKDDALTTVVIKVHMSRGKDLVFIGQSICNMTDTFDSKTGYKIARKRAENNLLGWVKTEMMNQAVKLGNNFNVVQSELMMNKKDLMGEEAYNEWLKAWAHQHTYGCDCDGSCV